MAELVGEGGRAGWGHSSGWFDVGDCLYALPHAQAQRSRNKERSSNCPWGMGVTFTDDALIWHCIAQNVML